MRGLNGLNKQKEVKLLCNENNVGLIGLLETKIKINRVPELARTMFEDGNLLPIMSSIIMAEFGWCGDQTFIM